MRLYRTLSGPVVEQDGSWHRLPEQPWDDLINRDDLGAHLTAQIRNVRPDPKEADLLAGPLPPPIGSQEVWASGVTYLRSRQAREEEAQTADVYARVYAAERPELFFKAPAWRVVGHGGAVRIRRDSTWNVPEPELVLLATSSGHIVGVTIGNDMSSRSIEGENPLYLPQAKIYDGACALGPCILVSEETPGPSTEIRLVIMRAGQTVFEGGTTLAQLKRKPQLLVDYLFRETRFPAGCFLFTGTGIVPEGGFTLKPGDEVRISISGIGTLTNPVSA